MDAIGKLKKNLHEEKEAIRDYRKAASKGVDRQTARLFRSIAKDESEHRVRITRRLRQLSKKK